MVVSSKLQLARECVWVGIKRRSTACKRTEIVMIEVVSLLKTTCVQHVVVNLINFIIIVYPLLKWVNKTRRPHLHHAGIDNS